MKKFMFILPLTIFCIICSLSFQYYYFIHPLNSLKVKNTISYLSSDNFKGRLTGTLENYETAAFIKHYFKLENLSSYNKDYLQSFNVVYPEKIDAAPYLIVKDKNGFIVKQYKYATDYKEDMLNFKNSIVSFKKGDVISPLGNSFQVQTSNQYFLFYTPKNNNLDFRSSFISNSRGSMYIMIKEQTAREIKNYLNLGCEISCFIPFHNKLTSAYNVIGYIKGKNPALPPLVLSAHFDHLGSDLSGTIYSGALDNASGTSFLLGLIKYINSIGKPERNIVIAAFNAEEFGCLGSKNFAQQYKDTLRGGKVINFDMLGSDKNVPLSIMAGKWDSKNSPFVKEIAQLCTSSKINFKYAFENSSDHQYFRAYNIDALTLSDADTSKIHTPMDKSQYINTKSIDRCFNVVSKEIDSYAFNNNPFILYSKYLLVISFCGILIMVNLYLHQFYK
ncbi:M28 family metallopeptidase [Clostridium autoethanogenum]|uniref:M28 family peptidase n=2 Tax=Clostridium autoethanogenum TaxID=84023 RepID=A0A3M0T2N2_9CLOT|nr:M28 family metallopeptidase [Clostridium autoethanogenum]AGY76579.1 M28 family metallopeptidase [Clostridium autoethanogenum DSM 10061]ALU36737.1 Peptidase M28 [Clostridium autoethanogenum DSM 10061]OVY50573.1 Peptidase family M28 [Clostridium autoethanogenum]RMD04880.1 M28 family peptidase [Clostridium autoethanogenum]